MVEINYWTNGKICAKVAFPRYTESVKFRSQSRETASKRKPYRGHHRTLVVSNVPNSQQLSFAYQF